MNNLKVLTTNPGADYELLDSGDNEKLERYGEYIVRRPDPQALWSKILSEKEWRKADAHFTSSWQFKGELPERWEMELGGLRLWIKPTSFKHVGVFPEQESNWLWVRDVIMNAKRQTRVLNLFGYTGGASLAASDAGAEVVHVDGSKTAINWGKDNAELSGLGGKPIRWILDDAREFVRREIRRGNKYNGIILDPPAFGHGPNKELWKIEQHLPELLQLCKQVLSDESLFFLINGYASGYSAIAYDNNLKTLLGDYSGEFEKGELTIAESGSDRLLPCGIFARWKSV